MNIQSLGQGLVAGVATAMSTAGAVGVIFGATYILDCRRFATTNEGIKGCYAYGGALAGVGEGVSGLRAGGFEKGFNTFNPSLRSPGPTLRRRGKQDPAEPEDGGRPS